MFFKMFLLKVHLWVGAVVLSFDVTVKSMMGKRILVTYDRRAKSTLVVGPLTKGRT